MRDPQTSCGRFGRRLAALALGLALAPLMTQGATAAVITPSGAYADTVLVCQRLWGAYTIGPRASGFAWARVYRYNGYTEVGTWGAWQTVASLSAGAGLPVRGQLAVYVEYAAWTGSTWEFAGEWGKVYDARGQHVSWYC